MEGFLKNDFGIVLNYNKCELNFKINLNEYCKSKCQKTGALKKKDFIVMISKIGISLWFVKYQIYC